MKLCSVFLFFITVLNVGYCRNNYIRKDGRVQKNHSMSRLEYYTKPDHTQTNHNPTVRIMIHIDKVLTEKLYHQFGPKTRRKLIILSKNIITDVESFFRHPSLNSKIRFVLLGTRFLKNNTNFVEMDENATKYLRSYCQWQRQKKNNNWYYSVLITGLDVYYVDNKGREVRKSTGRGFQGGMCSVRHSCTVLEWHPKNTAYLLAHEIGHSLGIPHDDQRKNQCRKGYMMSATYNSKVHPKSWSTCSKLALKQNLASGRTWCLRPKLEKLSIRYS